MVIYRDFKEPVESKAIVEISPKNSWKKDKGKPHNYPKFGRKCSQKFTRWGRVEDKEVFNILHQILGELNISMEEFFDFDPSSIFDDVNLRIKGRLQNEVVKKIWIETNWRKRPYFLMKRIFKKYSCQDFSYREVKALKRTVMSLKAGWVLDERTILRSYPGKTLKTIYAAIQDVLQGKFIQDYVED